MKRRRVLLACFALASAPIAALAQRPAGPPRVGYLVFGARAQGLHEAFIQGLRDLGYVEGRNIVVEYRFADRSRERLKKLAEELVRLEVDVIVAPDPPSYRAAMNATKTIPIVIRASYDPVADGVVASLSRPGGNVTGVFSLYSDLIGKRLEILKEVIPSTSRVLTLYDSRGGPAAAVALDIAHKAAAPLGMRLLSKNVHSAADLPAAFHAGAGEHADGLLVLRAPLFVETTAQIARLAATTRLPAVYDEAAYPDAGGLMSYGPSIRGLYRQTAKYVDRILRGARPADLPVEQPTELEFIVNVRAARALGLTIDPSVLLRADRVIE